MPAPSRSRRSTPARAHGCDPAGRGARVHDARSSTSPSGRRRIRPRPRRSARGVAATRIPAPRAVVAVKPSVIKKGNCTEGWYELVAGGFVCGKFVDDGSQRRRSSRPRRMRRSPTAAAVRVRAEPHERRAALSPPSAPKRAQGPREGPRGRQVEAQRRRRRSRIRSACRRPTERRRRPGTCKTTTASARR